MVRREQRGCVAIVQQSVVSYGLLFGASVDQRALQYALAGPAAKGAQRLRHARMKGLRRFHLDRVKLAPPCKQDIHLRTTSITNKIERGLLTCMKTRFVKLHENKVLEEATS